MEATTYQDLGGSTPLTHLESRLGGSDKTSYGKGVEYQLKGPPNAIFKYC